MNNIARCSFWLKKNNLTFFNAVSVFHRFSMWYCSFCRFFEWYCGFRHPPMPPLCDVSGMCCRCIWVTQLRIFVHRHVSFKSDQEVKPLTTLKVPALIFRPQSHFYKNIILRLPLVRMFGHETSTQILCDSRRLQLHVWVWFWVCPLLQPCSMKHYQM